MAHSEPTMSNTIYAKFNDRLDLNDQLSVN